MDVYDLAEWCSLAELGALSMDNNSAAVTFPDFTRGFWNKQDGYKHQYASPEAEAATEAAAAAYTKSQKEATAKFKLWNLYDAVAAAKKANNAKALKSATVKYNKAVAAAKKAMNAKK